MGLSENTFLKKEVAGYKIKSVLGQGGMSTVYYGVKGEKEVAIKIISFSLSSDSKSIARFLREAQSLQKLQSPQIVRILEYGSEAGLPYIVMEYIPGKTLRDIMDLNPVIAVPQALYIVREIATGLSEMANSKMVHRDIKPDNIMLTPKGEVKLTDFGLAKSIAQSVALTKPGQIFGTAHYMSPEQCRGEKLDIRSDLYSLGALLYEMSTGRTPFPGNNAIAILSGHLEQPVSWPASPAIPDFLKKLVETLMAKLPGDRFRSPKDLLAAIGRLPVSPTCYVWQEIMKPASNIVKNPLVAQEATFPLICPSCKNDIGLSRRALHEQSHVVCPSCRHSFSADDLLSTDEWYAIYASQESPSHAKGLADENVPALGNGTASRSAQPSGNDTASRNASALGNDTTSRSAQPPGNDTASRNVPIPENFSASESDMASLENLITSGNMMDKYRIEAEIGRGAMGRVFKIFDPDLDRFLAMKILIPTKESSEEEIKRFKRGIKASARLRHPNIVSVYNAGVWHEVHYFTMDYIAGMTLEQKLKSQKVTPRQALIYLRDIGKAIACAHEKGILHRDIKPANILVDEHDTPFVTDFGLAKEFGKDAKLTQSGAIVGTPCYMSPEQAQGEKLDVRSDVYSLGAMLYEMLTGQTPHKGDNLMSMLHSIIAKEPTPISRLVHGVHQDIATICMKTMHKVPSKRYPSAQSLVDDIERFLEGRPIFARPESFTSRVWRFMVFTKVQGIYAWIILAFLVVLFALFVYPKIYHNHGLALLGVDKQSEALEAFNRALWIRSNYEPSLVYRGVCYQQLGQADRAMADFNRVIEINPDFFLAYLYRGRLYLITGNKDLAMQDYERALVLRPEHPLPRFYRGELYMVQNEQEKAQQDFEKGLALTTNEDWNNERARIYFLLAVMTQKNPEKEKQCMQWLEKAMMNGFDDYPALSRMLPWQRWRKSEMGKKLIERFPALKIFG